MLDDSKHFKLGEEQYTILKSFNDDVTNFKVHKVYEVNEPNVLYVIKEYKTTDAFERELLMFGELRNAENIMQMINSCPSQAIIKCECPLYDLESYWVNREHYQRHEDIIKDVLTGLLELQKRNIVHNGLTPKSIMYFQEKEIGSWKLTDFDTACFTDSLYDVQFTTNYSAPEVMRAYEKEIKIKANFSMDMFSLGLILYFIETGHHYWDGDNEEKKEEIISEKPLTLINIQASVACDVLNELLDKYSSRRMTLKEFMHTPYYINVSEQTDNTYREHQIDDETNSQESVQAFLERYHNEMKQSLKILNDKIDNRTKTVEDIYEFTKKIPHRLVQLKNENVPRVFVIIPDQKDWKRPASWLVSKPFRLFFVCEHKEQWHVPYQEGYKILETPQFIKKYGPWINLCLQTLSVFQKVVASNLSSIFNTSNTDITQYFQEIIDTIDIGVRTVTDENPDFIPLNDDKSNPYLTINAIGLRELKRFLDTKSSADNYGGLTQCFDDQTQEILWLCEAHRNEYYAKTVELEPSYAIPSPPSSSMFPKMHSNSSNSFRFSPNPSSISSTSLRSSNSLGSFNNIPIPNPGSSNSFSSLNNFSIPNSESNFRSKINITNLDPFTELENLHKILCELIENTMMSGSKHFRNDNTAQKLSVYMSKFKDLCSCWFDNDQKLQFINIVKKQVHLYIYCLRSIVRYCIAKSSNSVRERMSLFIDGIFENNNIIKAGKSFNEHLDKLIVALEGSQYDRQRYFQITAELDNFKNDPKLYVNIDNDSNIISVKDLSQWYHTVDRICIENLESLIDIAYSDKLFNSTKQILDGLKLITVKSFKFIDHVDNFLCVEKEIYLYNEHKLNDSDYIIKFCGYSIQNCKPILFHEYANFAWEISQGVKYLHEKKILHLDLRSENILLQYEEMTKNLVPKISNFLWSKYSLYSKISVNPKITIPSNEQVWKRWYDPDRLRSKTSFESLLPPSDIYSLGLLFWEIAWSRDNNLPFKDVPINELYIHICLNHHKEILPSIPLEYKSWKLLIDKMWQLKSEDRCNIIAVEITMKNLLEDKITSESAFSKNLNMEDITESIDETEEKARKWIEDTIK
ncbi:17633_t:CDS:10 [Funneliformis caledonium]|uniref:17633_t:CDS:1 n=1 Tax=Funneliformis caledonium TaxID=1117310 RepID=A0A9N8W8U2_9GLOM|nr:17633_t:CDS:10 [Funneliformis caledonium]